MDNVVTAERGPARYNHFIGSLEPMTQFEGAYRGTAGGIEFELFPARNGAGEHCLALHVVTDGTERPGYIGMRLGQ